MISLALPARRELPRRTPLFFRKNDGNQCASAGTAAKSAAQTQGPNGWCASAIRMLVTEAQLTKLCGSDILGPDSIP